MVRAVFGTVKAMKGNLREVERIMKAAAAKPLIQVRNFCVSVSLYRDCHPPPQGTAKYTLGVSV